MQEFSIPLSVMQSFEHVVEVLVFQHRIECRLHAIPLFSVVVADLNAAFVSLTIGSSLLNRTPALFEIFRRLFPLKSAIATWLLATASWPFPSAYGRFLLGIFLISSSVKTF